MPLDKRPPEDDLGSFERQLRQLRPAQQTQPLRLTPPSVFTATAPAGLLTDEPKIVPFQPPTSPWLVAACAGVAGMVVGVCLTLAILGSGRWEPAMVEQSTRLQPNRPLDHPLPDATSYSTAQSPSDESKSDRQEPPRSHRPAHDLPAPIHSPTGIKFDDWFPPELARRLRPGSVDRPELSKVPYDEVQPRVLSPAEPVDAHPTSPPTRQELMRSLLQESPLKPSLPGGFAAFHRQPHATPLIKVVL